MWKAMLDESQAGIKIAGRNIKNLRYAEDTTLMGEREEEHHWLNGHELEHLWEILKHSVAWCAAVHGVTKSWTQLSNWTTTTKCLKHVDTNFGRRALQHYVTERSGILILNLFYKDKSNEPLTSEIDTLDQWQKMWHQDNSRIHDLINTILLVEGAGLNILIFLKV